MKGCLFSLINACVAMDFCCVLVIAHLHHSSMWVNDVTLIFIYQLSYSKIHKNYTRDQIISCIFSQYFIMNMHAFNIRIIIMSVELGVTSE